jgi:hypothetical protein
VSADACYQLLHGSNQHHSEQTAFRTTRVCQQQASLAKHPVERVPNYFIGDYTYIQKRDSARNETVCFKKLRAYVVTTQAIFQNSCSKVMMNAE